MTERKADLIRRLGRHGRDNGSPAVQLAMLTRRLEDLREELAADPGNQVTRQMIVDVGNRRRNVATYLQRNHPEVFREVSEILESGGADDGSHREPPRPPRRRVAEGEERDPSLPESTGHIVWRDKKRGFGEIEIDGTGERVRFVESELLDGNTDHQRSLRFVVRHDRGRGIAERIRFRTASDAEVRANVHPELLDDVEAMGQLDALRRLFTFRSGVLVKDGIARQLEALWERGFLDQALLRRILTSDKRDLVVMRHITALTEGAADELQDVLRRNFVTLLDLQPVSLLSLLRDEREVLGDARVTALIADLVCAGTDERVPPKLRQYAQLNMNKLPTLFARLHRGGVDITPDAIQWFILQSCFAGLKPDTASHAFDAFRYLANDHPQLAQVLLAHITAFETLAEAAMTGDEWMHLHVLALTRRIAIRPGHLPSLFARNLDFLTRHGMWESYRKCCRRLRVENVREMRMHLVDLEYCFTSVKDAQTMLPLLAQNSASWLVRRPHPLITMPSDGAVPQVSLGRLRQALDLLVNRRYSAHIAAGTLPPVLADLFDLEGERLEESRQSIAEHQLLEDDKFSGAETSDAEVVEAAEHLADALLLGAPLQEPLGSSLETIGAMLSDLLLTAKSTLRFDSLVVERSVVPLETLYHGIDACIFNNRGYARDGIRLALDGDVEMFFLRAMRGSEVARDLACVIAWRCRDNKETAKYLVIDGVAAAELSLRSLSVDWRDLLLDALVLRAERLEAQLAVTPALRRGTPSDVALFRRMEERFALSSEKVMLLKRRPSGTPYYNSIWLAPRTVTKAVGGTRILIAANR